MTVYRALILSVGLLLALSTAAQELDDRFVPISDIPDQLAETLARSVRDYSIDGEILRSQVAAGTIAINGWDPLQKKTSIEPDRIRTQAFLEAYAQSVVLEDERVTNLKFSEQTITIMRTYRGALLGFIPIDLDVTINIAVPEITEGEAAGQIEVRLPWYHFFVKKPFSKNEIVNSFATEIVLVNSEHATQRIAQYLQVIGRILRES